MAPGFKAEHLHGDIGIKCVLSDADRPLCGDRLQLLAFGAPLRVGRSRE